MVHPANASVLGEALEWQLTQLLLGTAGGVAIAATVIPGCKLAAVANVGVPYSPAAVWQAEQALLALVGICPAGWAADVNVVVLP